MTIMNVEDIVTKLRELKPIITSRYKAREVGLFGSFVRGEQGANSDIDVLAEFEDEADLFAVSYTHLTLPTIYSV